MPDRATMRSSEARTALDPLVRLLAENAAAVDREARFPVENLKAIRDTGYLGLLVPVTYGGLGLGLPDLVAIARRLAGGCLSTAMIFAMHCQQVDVLVRHADARLAATLLPRIAAGEVYLASVTTDSATGGHLQSASEPLTRVEPSSVHFRRDAPVVTGGRHADGFLITMRDGPDAGEHAVSLVYADRSDITVEPYGTWNPLGMRGTDSGPLRLAGTVRDDQIVGGPRGFRAVAADSMVPVGHLAWSACWLGSAGAVLATLVRHLAHDDRTDVSSPLVRERIARIRLDLELVSAYLGRVCEEVEQGRARQGHWNTVAPQIHLNMLKIAASELSFRAVDRMVQLAGMSLGYSADSPIALERALRDLRSAALNYSNDRLWTATGGLCLVDRKVTLL